MLLRFCFKYDSEFKVTHKMTIWIEYKIYLI